MQSVNTVMKWSCILSGMAGLMSLSIIFASWFTIEAMAVFIALSD